MPPGLEAQGGTGFVFHEQTEHAFKEAVYRALVRAKVACIRLCQSGLSDAEKNRGRGEYRGYANLAARYTQPPPPAQSVQSVPKSQSTPSSHTPSKAKSQESSQPPPSLSSRGPHQGQEISSIVPR